MGDARNFHMAIKCDKCGSEFNSDDACAQHKRAKHGGSEKVKYGLYAVGGVAVLVAVMFLLFRSAGSSSGSTIDGVECNTMEQAAFHIHAHLDVFVGGQPYTVPANVGIPGTCLYWLHTHDATGVIHIEAPYVATFKLGQFLDIWGRAAVDPKLPSGTPAAYVNGKAFSGNYSTIPLNAHDEIALVYGTVPAQIPDSYSFPQGM